MGSATKFTKNRRRNKATKKAGLRAKKANKLLSKLKSKGFFPKIELK